MSLLSTSISPFSDTNLFHLFKNMFICSKATTGIWNNQRIIPPTLFLHIPNIISKIVLIKSGISWKWLIIHTHMNKWHFTETHFQKFPDKRVDWCMNYFFSCMAFKKSYHVENTFNKFNLNIVEHSFIRSLHWKCYLMLMLEHLQKIERTKWHLICFHTSRYFPFKGMKLKCVKDNFINLFCCPAIWPWLC